MLGFVTYERNTVWKLNSKLPKTKRNKNYVRKES